MITVLRSLLVAGGFAGLAGLVVSVAPVRRPRVTWIAPARPVPAADALPAADVYLWTVADQLGHLRSDRPAAVAR